MNPCATCRGLYGTEEPATVIVVHRTARYTVYLCTHHAAFYPAAKFERVGMAA